MVMDFESSMRIDSMIFSSFHDETGIFSSILELALDSRSLALASNFRHRFVTLHAQGISEVVQCNLPEDNNREETDGCGAKIPRYPLERCKTETSNMSSIPEPEPRLDCPSITIC